MSGYPSGDGGPPHQYTPRYVRSTQEGERVDLPPSQQYDHHNQPARGPEGYHYHPAPPQQQQTPAYDNQYHQRQTEYDLPRHQTEHELQPPSGYYASNLRGADLPSQHESARSQQTLPPRPPLPPRLTSYTTPAPPVSRGSYHDEAARSYAPLRSEPATPGPPHAPPRAEYQPTSPPPAPSPGTSPALLPPHLRPQASPHQPRSPQYTPSPLSGPQTASQYEDATNLPQAMARTSLGSDRTGLTPSSSPAAVLRSRMVTNLTGPPLLHQGTGSSHQTQSTAVSTQPSFGTRRSGDTVPTVIQTPGSDKPGDGKPVHIAEQLEALPLTSFYVRPGYGSSGRKLSVESNYFAVRAIGDRGKIIHHYDIAIEPVVRSTSQKLPRQLLRSVWEQLAIEYENRPEWKTAFAAAAFDGRRNAYTPVRFPIPDKETPTLTVALSPTREVQRQKDSSSDDEYRRFRLTFKKVAEIDLEAVMRFCRANTSENRNPKDEEACLTGVMATNILMRDVPSKTYTQVGATGQNFYTMEDARPLPHGAVVANGFMQSFRYSNSGFPLLNIDLGFSAFLKSGPCIEVINAILGPGPAGFRGGPGGPRGGGPRGGMPHHQQGQLRSLDEMQVTILKRKLRGARFTVTHRQSSRLHTVITVTSRSARSISFTVEGKNGEPEHSISVAQYYQEYYNAPLQYPDLPCIQYGKRAYVPLEFVNLAEFNSLPPTNLQADQIAEMIKHSAMRPPDRKLTIMKWRERLAHEKQTKIADWGLQVNKKMVTIDARVLPTPDIKYSHNRTMKPRDGSWNLRQLQFFRDSNRPLKNWAIVSFDRYCDEGSMQRWAVYLAGRLAQLGITVANREPPLISPVDPRVPGVITEKLQLAARAAYMVSKEPPQLICVILPGKDAWLYEQIKRIAFTDLKAPVPTQCMQAAKVKVDGRGIMAYTDNLCMKIAQKLGGLSHQVSLNDLPGMVRGKTMILGADLGHPPFRPNSTEPTVACSIATYNADCDAYSAQIRLQEGRREIIADLSSMVEEHLRIFAKENGGEYPERILVFRDGISEGQYAAALQYEHHAITTACTRVQPGYRPRILVCVCARRHNTRFFARGPQDEDRSGNLPAGLVVDKSVTHPYAFDFFLQAHSGLVGTARPTHYICLLDELGITPDQLQQLCNSLSYSFARCTKAVSLVPVCYMADLVCQKARLLVQKNDDGPSPSEFSGSRAQSRFGAAPSIIGSEATTALRRRFEEKHDIYHIQKLLAKNPELSRVGWWM